MNALRKLSLITVGAAVLSVPFLSSESAQAAHVFFQNVKINNTALETTSGFTNPTFNINIGDTLEFAIEVYGSADTLFTSFTKNSGTLDTPLGQSFSYSGGATSSNPSLFSFTRSFSTAGTFNGMFNVDLTSSFPDYNVPSTGAQVDTRQFAFTANVSNAQAQPVPEPASVLGIMAFGALGGGRLLKRKKQAALASK